MPAVHPPRLPRPASCRCSSNGCRSLKFRRSFLSTSRTMRSSRKRTRCQNRSRKRHRALDHHRLVPQTPVRICCSASRAAPLGPSRHQAARRWHLPGRRRPDPRRAAARNGPERRARARQPLSARRGGHASRPRVHPSRSHLARTWRVPHRRAPDRSRTDARGATEPGRHARCSTSARRLPACRGWRRAAPAHAGELREELGDDVEVPSARRQGEPGRPVPRRHLQPPSTSQSIEDRSTPSAPRSNPRHTPTWTAQLRSGPASRPRPRKPQAAVDAPPREARTERARATARRQNLPPKRRLKRRDSPRNRHLRPRSRCPLRSCCPLSSQFRRSPQ